MQLSKIKECIKNGHYKIISFDLYDTVLFRPFLSDGDKFNFISDFNHEVNNFCEKRINAQRKAIQDEGKGNEISIDKIYDQFKILTRIAKVDRLIKKELLAETLSYTLPEIRQLINEIRKENKKIICISDMYLNKEFIEGILKKEKIKFDELYISSKTGKTKSSGKLFVEVFEDLKNRGLVNEPSEILHIGDNRLSDFQNAKAAGFNAICLEENIIAFKNDPETKHFLKLSDGLNSTERLILGIIAKSEFSLYNSSNKENQLFRIGEELGYRYGGPIIFNIANWLYNLAKEKRKNTIVLLRRDGYTISQYFNKLSNNNIIEDNINTIYLPISRVFTYAINYKHESDIYERLDEHPIKSQTTIGNFFDTRFHFVKKERIDELLKIYKYDRSSKIKDIGENNLKKFLQDNSAELYLYANKEKYRLKQFYKNRIKNCGDCSPQFFILWILCDARKIKLSCGLS